MTSQIELRRYRPADAPALRGVFHRAVHGLACRDYTREQLQAWAPLVYDEGQWAARLQANSPFIAELDGQVAGFADLQPDGYIDQFFVDAAFAGRGVASALMNRIEQTARALNLAGMFSDVSLRAERFFTMRGFEVVARKEVEVHGVMLRNARMQRRLDADPSARRFDGHAAV